MKKDAIATIVAFVSVLSVRRSYLGRWFVLAAFLFLSASPTWGQSAADVEKSLLHNRAVEAVIWATPLVYISTQRQAYFNMGAKLNEVLYWSAALDWKGRFLTPNNTVLYIVSYINTKNGPIVLDLPAAAGGVGIFGTLLDAWQTPLDDVGPEGVDKGKGGKYLILPPGHAGAIPDGYIPIKSPTYNVAAVFRTIPKSFGEKDMANAEAYIKRMRVYPLAKAADPPATRYVDGKGKLFDAVSKYDISFYEHLSGMLNEEPVFQRDKMIVTNLRPLGIVKGQPFAPSAENKAILQQAVADAYKLLRARFHNVGSPFWKGKHWTTAADPLETRTQFTYVTDDAYLTDLRGTTYWWACCAPKHLGGGSAYFIGQHDSSGALLDGSKNYVMNVPPKVPAKQFWSINVYDGKSGAFIENVDRVGLTSLDPKVESQPDGSVDVYFGPKAPAGKAANWIPTKSGESFFLLFRFYGPEKALFDKSWTGNDLKVLN